MLRKTRLPAACALAGALTVMVLAGAQAKRATSSAARYLLNIDGASVTLASFKGGGVFADVVSDANGEKHPGPPRAEDIVISLPVNTALAQQLASSVWTSDARPRSGSIVAVDSVGSALSEIQFRDAAITEASLPACDAASKEPGYITITLAPEQITTAGAGGKVPATTTDKTTDRWIASSFRLEIDDVDCTRISRIEPLVARRGEQSSAGVERVRRKSGGALDVANVRVILPVSSAQSWQRWFDELVVKGDASREKTGTLTLLGPDLKAELAVIRLHNLGLIRLTPETTGATDAAPRLVAEMYCERLELVSGSK